MSTVTNLILVANGIGAEANTVDDDELVTTVVNEWLAAREFRPLKQLHTHYEAYAGNKVLEASVFVAAYNYFPVEEFVAFLQTVKWAEPDLVQCFVQLQDEDKFRDWMTG